MDRKIFIESYWKYYLFLENKFLQTVNYVEPSKNNFSTYSHEYVYLLQSIGGELDTVFKIYCGFRLDDDSKDMKNYRDATLFKYPDIVSQKIIVQEYNLELQPFKNWSNNSVKWWRAYNFVKHNRYDNMKSASQRNVLNILAALFIIEMKYLKEIVDDEKEPDIPENQSKLFILKDWQFRWLSTSGSMFQLRKSS